MVVLAGVGGGRALDGSQVGRAAARAAAFGFAAAVLCAAAGPAFVAGVLTAAAAAAAPCACYWVGVRWARHTLALAAAAHARAWGSQLQLNHCTAPQPATN